MLGGHGRADVLIVVRLIPGQLDGGRLNIVPQYLTAARASATDNRDYLKTAWPPTPPRSGCTAGSAAAGRTGAGGQPLAAGAKEYDLRRYGVFRADRGRFAGGRRALFPRFRARSRRRGQRQLSFRPVQRGGPAFPDPTRVPLWMNSQLWTKPALILITMWSSGAGMLIFLAALKGVPKPLYESAEVDGRTAGKGSGKLRCR